jgi:hypothetical protein
MRRLHAIIAASEAHVFRHGGGAQLKERLARR